MIIPKRDDSYIVDDRPIIITKEDLEQPFSEEEKNVLRKFGYTEKEINQLWYNNFITHL